MDNLTRKIDRRLAALSRERDSDLSKGFTRAKDGKLSYCPPQADLDKAFEDLYELAVNYRHMMLGMHWEI